MARRKGMKRKRSRRKGSTKSGQDDYHQELVNVVTVANNTTWAAANINVPLLNLPERPGKARVLEITKVEFMDVTGGNATAPFFAALGSLNLNNQTVSNYAITQAFTDKRIFVTDRVALGTSSIYDLTDEAGKGILYPAQQIYVNVVMGTAGAGQLAVRVYYRVKYATMAEYLGIVNQYIVNVF